MDAKLREEARREGVSRPELARKAITEFLTRRERERFVSAFTAEVRAAYGNTEICRAAISIAEETLWADGNVVE